MRLPRMTIGRWMIAVAIVAALMGVAVLYERARAIVYDPLWQPSAGSSSAFTATDDL